MKIKRNYKNSEVSFELRSENNRGLLGTKSENCYIYGHKYLRNVELVKHFIFVKCETTSILYDLCKPFYHSE